MNNDKQVLDEKKKKLKKSLKRLNHEKREKLLFYGNGMTALNDMKDRGEQSVEN